MTTIVANRGRIRQANLAAIDEEEIKVAMPRDSIESALNHIFRSRKIAVSVADFSVSETEIATRENFSDIPPE